VSDATDQYVERAKQKAESQDVSLRTDLSETLRLQGWQVRQVSFIAGARSLNEVILRE
jgi:hypothetical protein